MAVQSLSANKDIDYIHKDFSSSEDAIINFANVNFGPGTSANRLWTNFNTDSFSRNWLEIVAFMSDVFFFYFDNQATQSYLQTATVRSAVEDIAKQFGFVPSTESSASGNVVFTFTAAGTILRGFRLSSSNGLPFYLTNTIVATSAGNYTGTVLQGEIKTEQFSAQGIQDEEFTLIGPNVIKDLTNLNPLDMSPQITVNGNSYTLVNSFIKNNGTDSPAIVDSLGEIIGGGGRVFTLGKKPNDKPFIKFGDGIFGRKLLPGEIVTVIYRTGVGSAGNIGEQSLTTLIDSNPALASAINPAKFSGGADEQSIEQLRDLIPASLRTLQRAVAESDYSDLLKLTFTEVAAASTERNTSDPGIDLNIYVVPTGSGITKITDNTNLKTRLSNFLDRRKMVTVQFQILDAFGVDVLLTIKVFITNTASKSTVKNAINTTLTDFFDLISGGTSGAGIGFAEEILTEDLSALIKAIPGVERFEFSRHTYRPRIAKNILGLNTAYNTSPVEIFPNVSQSEWLAGASGSINRTSDALLFSNSSLITFSYNSTTGVLTYSLPVDLNNVSPGDFFYDGLGQHEITQVQTRGDGVGVAEVSKVTTVADQEGFSEITKITTTPGTFLSGKYFLIYDTVGSVAVWFNTGSSTQPSHGAVRAIMVSVLVGDTDAQIATKLQTALNADSEFTATVLTNEVTVTLDQEYSVFDAADGHVGANTTFTFAVLQQGETPNSLSGKYFDIYDNVGPVRVWYDVTGLGSTPPATPGGGRLLAITIGQNDSATAVASSTQTTVNADVKFNATSSTNNVTITDAFVGTRTDITAGTSTFTVSVLTQGANANTLGGTYFDMQDKGVAEVTSITCPAAASISTGQYFLINSANDDIEYYLWYKKDGVGTDPAPSGKTGIQVNITTGDTANAVAVKTAAALNATASFSAPAPGAAIVTVTNEAIGPSTDASNFNVSGLSILVSVQGRGKDVRVWFDLDNLSVAPSTPAGGRLIEVDISSGDSANTVATKLKTTIDADSFYSATVSTNFVTVTDDFVGVRNDATDFNTGFTFIVTQQGTEDNTAYAIFGVDKKNYTLTLSTGLNVNTTVTSSAHGSIRSGSTSYGSYKVFKKLNASATNLSIDSVTDNSLDLAVISGTGTALSARVLLDNSQIFIIDQYSTGNFYLVDAAGNVWEIVSNDSNTFTTSITAVNDASVTNVASGDYKVVKKLVGNQIAFNGNIFNIQFNSDKTLYSVGAQFSNIGTIGDTFQISKLQDNLGNFGVALDLISYDSNSNRILLNGSPDLLGITPNYDLIDSSGKIFNVASIDNRALPSVFYDEPNQDSSLILKSSGLGVQYAQGFKVSANSIFSVVSFNLKRSGNIVGNLSAKIVGDDGTGLPNFANPIVTSLPVSVPSLPSFSQFDSISAIPSSGFNTKIAFSFTTPPALVANTQYHLVISGDASYNSAQTDNAVMFNNSGPTSFSYNSLSGVIQYASTVNLSSVQPGHYFRDGLGKLFQITSVDDSTDRITLATGLSIDNTLSSNSGSVYKKDNVYVVCDISSPTYADGKASQYDGVVWANDTQGPLANRLPQNTDFIFSVEGPKSIVIDSNLIPTMGPGATIAERYYDDENEISMIIGLSGGQVTSATDVNAIGRGTVNTVPNSKVDNFVFRTSKFVDDITNLRLNEIPQLSTSNVVMDVFGGVD